jgi:hypothetical protein
MATAVTEYEMEALPELGAGHEAGWSGETESEQFFGALTRLARQGVGSMTAPGSLQRRVAVGAARQAIGRGLSAVRGQLKPPCASQLSLDEEISPIRRIYPDAMMEHLGHAAAETHSEAEAEALAGALVPLAARAVPQAAPAILRAAPGLACGLAGVVRTLHRNMATRPLLRTVPAVVRSTAASIAQQVSRGATVTPQAAVRTLARQTARMLGSPQQAARAFRRSQRLDRQFHRAGAALSYGPTCNRYGGLMR